MSSRILTTDRTKRISKKGGFKQNKLERQNFECTECDLSLKLEIGISTFRKREHFVFHTNHLLFRPADWGHERTCKRPQGPRTRHVDDVGHENEKPRGPNQQHSAITNNIVLKKRPEVFKSL